MENEKRLIDAKPLIEDGWHLVKTGKSNVFLASMSLADAPTVDAVEVVHGRWRFCGSDRWNDAYECSECGKMAMSNSNYCPNCGADMRCNENG